MEHQEQEYFTKDLGEAAALYALGFVLKDLRPISTGKQGLRYFVFENEHPTAADPTYAYADEEAKRYHQHELLVDACSFFLSVKEMKSRIYADSGAYTIHH